MHSENCLPKVNIILRGTSLRVCYLRKKSHIYKAETKRKGKYRYWFLSIQSFLKVSITATSAHPWIPARTSEHPQNMGDFLLFTLNRCYYFLSQVVSVWNLTSSPYFFLLSTGFIWTVFVFGEYNGRKSSRIQMNGVYFSLIRSNSKQCEFG